MNARIVIVGAGFGGLNAAKKLAGDATLEVILIDSQNHHLFQPLLYQVATAELSPADIATPIRAELRRFKNCRVVMGRVEDILRESREVKLASGEVFGYDYLILACGSQESYFGHDPWREFAPGLKTLAQATSIRRQILCAFENAENEPDSEIQREWMTFVIVGGGPTGVELAGAIAEICRKSLVKDFRRISPESSRIMLVEAAPRILSAFPENLADIATNDLKKLGVEVVKGKSITHIDGETVHLGDEIVRCRTKIWSAGVKASALGSALKVPLDRVGRVVVNGFLNPALDDRIFVIGDMALAEQDGRPLPGLAPVAIQQGRYVANAIKARVHRQNVKPFRYLDKGIMATIGAQRAILKVGRLELSGFIAWLAWVFVHLLFLIGFRNRVFVLLQWGWEYFTFKRGARLILGREECVNHRLLP